MPSYEKVYAIFRPAQMWGSSNMCWPDCPKPRLLWQVSSSVIVDEYRYIALKQTTATPSHVPAESDKKYTYIGLSIGELVAVFVTVAFVLLWR